jgi:hypothetical protein
MPCGNVASGCRSPTVDSSSKKLYRYFGYVSALARGFVQLAAHDQIQLVIVQFNRLRLVPGFLHTVTVLTFRLSGIEPKGRYLEPSGRAGL